ncbi:hypothetical protein M758_8G070600 [Ceratodon purpureus]|nr:hypothetical protein M758_8G070600 [Ceratodon purpureus]
MASPGLMRIAFHRPRLTGFAISSRTLSGFRISPQQKHWWNARFHVNCSSVAAVEELSSRQSGQVAVFVDILLEWNQKMNLTAVTERGAMMDRHIADSLSLLPTIEGAYAAHCNGSEGGESVKVVDIGSGAGLPGIVLAIARPAWQLTLLESLQKRCDFLEHVAKEAGLTNVKVLRSRAEDAGKDIAHRETYDVAVARAVAEMRVLAELCLPLVRVGGILVAAKGPNPEEEVEAAKTAVNLLGASIVTLSRVDSQGPLGQRTAVVCLKDRPTPAKYPRRAGMPNKRPL